MLTCHRVHRKPSGSEIETSFCTVGNQMYGIDAGAIGERLSDVFYAVARRVQHEHFHVGADAIEEFLVVANAGREEQDFLSGSRLIVGRQRIE